MTTQQLSDAAHSIDLELWRLAAVVSFVAWRLKPSTAD